MKRNQSFARIALFLGILPWLAVPVLAVLRVSPQLIGWLALLTPAGAAGAGWVARKCWFGRIGIALAIAMFCVDAAAIYKFQSDLRQHQRDLELEQIEAVKRQLDMVE